ncbi:MAG: phage baseplate assembly protein V [Candidatus Krumholzibacteria bacterium]|nr:phage baseplate assembly protein V [Candidatus Krumholzibacteria bacterium]
MAVLETPAECLVRVDNKEIKFNVSLVRLDQYVDSHHRLMIRIQQVGKKEAGRDIDDPGLYTQFLGSTITLTINPKGGVVDGSRALEFIGVITDVQLDNSIDGLNTVLLHAASPTIAMDGAKRNAHFHDKTASDIVGSIVGNYPITIGRIESTKGTYKFDTQYRETDFEYVMRLAVGSGMFAWYSGRDFNLGPAGGENTVELKWREDLGAFRLGLGTAPVEFKSEVYNYEQKKTYSQDSKSISQDAVLSNLSKTSPDASRKIYKDSGFSSAPKMVADAQTLDKTLKNERRKAMGSMIRCVGQSIVPELRVGSCARITGMDKLDGQYWVIGVRHVFDESGKYHNTFECTPLDIAYPGGENAKRDLESGEGRKDETASVERVAGTGKGPVLGMHVARVVDLKDPDKLGRIKISYPWLDSEQTAWVRMVVPHAGKDRGWYALPEPDDEVLVGYEHGNTDHPVVLGCLYNKGNAPMQEAISNDNDIKMFMTRSGNKIVLNDAGGGEQIVISQKDGKNRIVLDISGPSISISTDGDISVTGKKNITIETDQGITMKAASDVKIEGANVEIKASANIKSEAGANNEIKGNAQVNVKGGMINLN